MEPTPARPSAAGVSDASRWPRRSRPVRFLGSAAGLAVIWLGLCGPSLESWYVGAPAVLVAAWTATRFPASLPHGLRWSGLLPFAFHFLRESVVGGWDVARRVLAPEMRIAPGHVTYRTSLPPGPARHLMLSTTSLLPGTLSAGIEGDCIDVHAIDINDDPMADLRRLEQRVAGLFTGFGDRS